eukprot:9362888-Alexandrium_andersonii.AAC.1
MASRERYSGEVGPLPDAISPSAGSPVWLKYDVLQQKGSKTVARVNTNAILKHKALISRLRALQRNV